MNRARSALQRFASLLALAGGLSACSSLPETLPRGPAGYAGSPRPGGPLAEMESRVLAAHGPDYSGFLLLNANEDGLRWRLALVDSAQHSLDLQYYVWWGDESGVLLMKRVVEAADRGVKVRLILDDFSTMLENEEHLKVRDRNAALVNTHPNIEIRLFNAWHMRSLSGRGIEALERMERINHRMHNKLLVADNRATIVGGRNVGNEYLGLSPEFNFRDLDVLGIGPVARQASNIFDNFWNSEWVVPVAALGVDVTQADMQLEYPSVLRKLESAKSLSRIPLDREDWSAALERAVANMHAGESRVHSDSPDHGAVTHHMPAAISELMGTAKHELLITNAYIIPDDKMIQRLRDLTSRGVTVRILTNSLASHDVPAVNSHYKKWRRQLIEAGVELHEMRHDAEEQGLLADTPPTVAEFMGLHVKAMVVDRERVFIGSMNLDPRSATINSEMGVVVESQGLAQALAAAMDRDMRPENSWRVTLGPDGSLRWTAGGRVLTSQPARNYWQRVLDVFFMAFPRDLY